MKKILIISVLLGLISCDNKGYVIKQVVSFDNSCEVSWDSSLKIPVWKQRKGYVLNTGYQKSESVYEPYSTDYGSAKYIDSIKCIRRSECQKELDELARLNLPCN